MNLEWETNQSETAATIREIKAEFARMKAEVLMGVFGALYAQAIILAIAFVWFVKTLDP